MLYFADTPELSLLNIIVKILNEIETEQRRSRHRS